MKKKIAFAALSFIFVFASACSWGWELNESWEYGNPALRFNTIEFEGSNYRNVFHHEILVEETNVGELLTSMPASIYNLDDYKYFTIECEIFAITGISEKYAVAVRFENSPKFHPYRSSYYGMEGYDYFPATLGDLIYDLNLRENLKINNVLYSYWKDKIVSTNTSDYRNITYILPDSVYWNLLFADESSENVYGKRHQKAGIQSHLQTALIYAEMDIIGDPHFLIWLYEDGYIYFFSANATFYIGEENMQAFFDYAVLNGEEYVKPNFTTP